MHKAVGQQAKLVNCVISSEFRSHDSSISVASRMQLAREAIFSNGQVHSDLHESDL